MFSASKSGSAVDKDPYFKNVSLLLHGDGTNGAQNNTFLDSSTNNFTITRNGNATQGSFSPYGSNWGNYFNGSTDYLSVADNTALTLNADFTIEFWFNQTSSGNFGILQHRNGTSWASGDFQIQTPSNTILFNTPNGSVSTTTFVLNTWNHYALVRSGSTITAYLNGVVSNTWTNSTSYTGNGGLFRIGELYDGTHYYFPGYLSNVRIVKGTAVYTSNFTPSTTPLTAITNTSLLTCQSNRFIDNSANNFALTVSGTPSVQRFSPFSPASAYSTSVIGGSGYFDGTGDYLDAGDQTAFNLSGGVYTLEAWIYPSGSYPTYATIINKRVTSSPNSSYDLILSVTTGSLDFYASGAYLSSGVTPKASSWNHIAAVHDGTNINLYLNGVRVLQAACPNTNYASNLCVGAYSGGEGFSGYISNARVTKGGQLYTGTTYTVPTSPLTTSVSSGTVSFLCNMTNGAIYDNAEMNDLETVGNAQISTAVKKYGTGSLYFDGSGDRLYVANATPAFGFGTGDYTVEFWLYIISMPGSKYTFIDFRPSAIGFPHTIYVTSSGYMGFFNGSADVTSSSQPLSAGSWYHVAYSRGSGTLKIFVNGTQAYSAANTSDYQATRTLTIGSPPGGLAGEELNGYIDDLRITKGIARYTANFTPPTAAFPNQ